MKVSIRSLLRWRSFSAFVLADDGSVQVDRQLNGAMVRNDSIRGGVCAAAGDSGSKALAGEEVIQLQRASGMELVEEGRVWGSLVAHFEVGGRHSESVSAGELRY